ncbi:Phage antirepressor protein YoqD, KilAC domain [Aneurinibacillus thermoaerophilus]|uniref:Phage antirepressor protein YoqD, KilAC domain n=1 Tax=Aneurinibacillus thermoaerophilus TaxID=143495 RepID=A0A1G8EKZ6_ANETH|nr:phage antirepressor KilAC domain-containing protein [Aneurinibacillus thermoaerophilus]SDH70462.1 Phage antirepressor protein YoqD, KilAC domain [Aneurinibacillus thermoaerophilus]
MDLIKFEGHEVRVLNQDGTDWDSQQEAWFIPKEVAVAIGASEPRKYASKILNRNPDKFEGFQGVTKLTTPGGMQEVTIINENGLYMFLMASDLPKAVQFQRQVTELLKNIRRGKVVVRPSYEIEDPIERAKRWIEEQQEKLMLQQRLAECEPKVTYYDTILQSKDLLNISQIAKDYGLSGNKLNRILKEEGVQFKMNGQWLLYQKHAEQGYTKSTTQTYQKSDGSQGTALHTKWTQKGRLFIHQLLEKRGITALIDREKEVLT